MPIPTSRKNNKPVVRRDRTFLSGVFGCVLVLLLSNCTGDSGEPVKESGPPIKVEKPAAFLPAPPDTAGSPAVTDETRAVYQWYCTQCHGLKGKGDGINAAHLTVPPRDHTKADYLETRTDQQLFMAIEQGGLSVGRAPCMPGWGNTLDKSAIASLVRYIRELCQCEAL